jgi:hypothetical protein
MGARAIGCDEERPAEWPAGSFGKTNQEQYLGALNVARVSRYL